MDTGLLPISSIDSIGPLLTTGAAAAIVTLSGTSIGLTIHALRRRLLWQSMGRALQLRQQAPALSLLATPTLNGIYRGRALEATLLPSGLARIVVRVANPRRLFDQIRADDESVLAGVVWISPSLRDDLTALRDRWRRAANIAIRGHDVTLTAPCAGADRKRLQSLLETAFRIAESVDSSTGAFFQSTQQPVKMPLRLM